MTIRYKQQYTAGVLFFGKRKTLPIFKADNGKYCKDQRIFETKRVTETEISI